jgi:hypothetical protein
MSNDDQPRTGNNLPTSDAPRTFTVFLGHRRLVAGPLEEVLPRTKAAFDEGPSEALLLFEDDTGRQVDFDLGGTLEEVLARYAPAPAAKAGPGRPKLGVISREVSLLPRHWEWLEQEPQGISAAIRRLVDDARKRGPDKQRARLAREAAGKFMWGMAGDLPDFEEASRALYAKDGATLRTLVAEWPADIRTHVVRMVTECETLESAAAPPSV